MSSPSSFGTVGRRGFLAGAAALGAAALYGRAPAVLAQSKAPLKIGLLDSFSTSGAAHGSATLNGMKLYFDRIGWTIAGRRIEIVMEDDQSDAKVGLEKLRKLVEHDHCDLITGLQASSVVTAALGYLRGSKTFCLCNGAGVADASFTGLPYLFRCSVSTRAIHSTMGGWYGDNVSKDVVTTASDGAEGRSAIREFKAGFLKKGGTVTKEIYPPSGQRDYSRYLADIRSIAPRATYNVYAADDAVRFVRQYDEYGLAWRTRLAAPGFMVEGAALAALGKSAFGVLSTLHYADTLDSAENRQFVASYRARFGEYPSVYGEQGYVAARIVHVALQDVDGNARDRDKLRDAMRELRFDAPRGPFRFDPVTQSPIQNVYVREVAELDGRITNRVLATYRDVVEPPGRT